LGWASGTADSVAREILNKFYALQRRFPKRLQLHPRSRATVQEDGSIAVRGKVDPVRADIIVLAVGFGVEMSPNDAAMNSYWRVDSLDQSFAW
jgi:hypothetical protein